MEGVSPLRRLGEGGRAEGGFSAVGVFVLSESLNDFRLNHPPEDLLSFFDLSSLAAAVPAPLMWISGAGDGGAIGTEMWWGGIGGTGGGD